MSPCGIDAHIGGFMVSDTVYYCPMCNTEIWLDEDYKPMETLHCLGTYTHSAHMYDAGRRWCMGFDATDELPEALRQVAATLEEVGWSDIEDIRNATVPVIYAVADELQRLREAN